VLQARVLRAGILLTYFCVFMSLIRIICSSCSKS
jgi:hypothetical protein